MVRSPSFAVEDGDDVDYEIKFGIIEDTLRLLNIGYTLSTCFIMFCLPDHLIIIIDCKLSNAYKNKLRGRHNMPPPLASGDLQAFPFRRYG